MNKRRIMLLALALCVIAILAVGGTLAYFTDTQTATNVFAVGNVDVTLFESKVKAGENADGIFSYVDDDGEERTVTENAYAHLLPGSSICKDPTVTNEGETAAYVRVRIKHNNVADILGAFDTLNDFYATWTGLSAVSGAAITGTQDAAADTAQIEMVFNEPFASGEAVTLFTSIEVPKAFDAAEMKAYENLEIEITASTIQASGFDSAAEALAAFDAQND